MVGLFDGGNKKISKRGKQAKEEMFLKEKIENRPETRIKTIKKEKG